MLPRVVLHSTVSLDGRIDWFTPDIGQFYELAATWKEDATLAGSLTICKPSEAIPPEDDSAFAPPEKTAGDTRPLLVVPDSRGRVRNWHVLRAAGYWRDFVALCAHSTPEEYLAYLKQRHVNCIVTGDERADLRAALEALNARYGVKTVRVDSGGVLNGVLLRAGLVQEVSVLVHPGLVGGTSPRSFFRAPDLTTAEGVIPLRLIQVEKLKGDAVWLRYELACQS
jgi:2,5-diamino-6-(ribosylamino)-4(3H)-pyrimidinone 5'-phosphate reductase